MFSPVPSLLVVDRPAEGWTRVLEAVAEYCRVSFDLFPGDTQIVIACPGTGILVDGSPSSQTMQNVMQAFERLYNVAEGKLTDVIEAGLDIISENPCVRVVAFLPERLATVPLERDNVRVLADVVVTDGRDFTFPERKAVRFHAGSDRVLDVTMRLAERHLNVVRVTVRAIPMKGSSEGGARSSYDVVLFAPNPHAHLSDGSSGSPSLVVQWRPAERAMQPTALRCKRAVRVTPLTVSTPANTALMKYLLSGKPVCLITPPGGKVVERATKFPPTHMLMSHKGDVYFRWLHTTKEEIPKRFLIPAVGGRPSTRSSASEDALSRVEALTKIIAANTLVAQCPRAAATLCEVPVDMGRGGVALTTHHVERHTRHFMEGSCFDRLPDKLRGVVDPLCDLLLLPTLGKVEVQQALTLATTLHALAHKKRAGAALANIVDLSSKVCDLSPGHAVVHTQLVHLCPKGTSQQEPGEGEVAKSTDHPTGDVVAAAFGELDRIENATYKELAPADKTRKRKRCANDEPADRKRRRKSLSALQSHLQRSSKGHRRFAGTMPGFVAREGEG